MKKLMILSLAMALLVSPAWGYKQEDLGKLAATNACEECDLRGADLERADLTGAVLRDAKIDFVDFTKAKFCNTVMPAVKGFLKTAEP